MKRKLSREFHPPAAILPVRMCAPESADSARVDGKIDTGADVCGVPERLVSELGLPPVRTVRAAGFGGVLQEVTAYRVDLEMDGLAFRRVEALATRRPYAIIGRNVLRSLVLHIDGPRELMELREPARSRSRKPTSR